MRLIPACLLSSVFAFSAGGQADPGSYFNNWSINGQNTLRLEQYDNFGDENSSPYPSTGFQAYDELNFTANQRVSAYERINFQAFGVANQSDYRSNDSGFILERAKLNWEKGNAPVPFRLQAGDFFAQQTFRTLQRSLKGIQLELQPRLSAEVKSSIQLFMGITDSVYRDLDENLNSFAGGSWLLENESLGAFSLTSVYNYRDSDNSFTLSMPSRNQWVNSIAWAKDFSIGSHTLQAESELAYFSGDVLSNNQVTSKNDLGVFAQINGRDTALPYDYRFRFERYGEYFQPAGGAVVPDRRTIEGHFGWRFQSGMQLRARAQTFRSNLESENHTDTDVVGINLSGPIWTSDDSVVIGQVDTYMQQVKDQQDTIDNHIYSVNANLTIPIMDRLSFRPGIFFNHMRNHNTGGVSIRRQLSLPFDYRFSMGGYTGFISPGLILRDTNGNNNGSVQASPTISMSLASDSHNLSLSHNVLIINPDLQTATESTTQQSTFRYTYSKGRNRIGLEANYFARDPTPGVNTDAYRVALTWTFSFDKPAGASTRGTGAASAYTAPAAGPRTITLENGRLYMRHLAPGMPVEALQKLTGMAGLDKSHRQGDMLIYETSLYEEIQRRQRLALIFEAGKLEKSVLAVDFLSRGDVDSMAQTYSRLRDILYKRYGTPDVQLEKGAFAPSIARDLSSRQFQRLNEWQTPHGVLRFGIPARTDGQVRMEIIHARTFPPYTDNHWGVEVLY